MGSLEFHLRNAWKYVRRTPRFSLPLFFGLLLSFTLVVGISGSTQVFYDDTLATLDQYGQGLVVVQRGVPFVNGLPIQSLVPVEQVETFTSWPSISSYYELLWTPESSEASVIGDLIIGVGRGSFDTVPYQLASDLELAEGRFPSYNTSELVVGRDTNAYRSNRQQWELRDRDFTITGSFDTRNYVKSRYLMTSLPVVQRLTGIVDAVNLVYIEPTDGNIQALEEELEESYPQLDALTREERDQMINEFLSRTEELTNYITILSLIIALVFTILVTKLMIDTRLKEFGILRSMGTTRYEVFLEFLGQFMIIGVSAAVIGGMLGFLSAAIVLFDILQTAISFPDLLSRLISLGQAMPWVETTILLFIIMLTASGVLIQQLFRKKVITLLGHS